MDADGFHGWIGDGGFLSKIRFREIRILALFFRIPRKYNRKIASGRQKSSREVGIFVSRAFPVSPSDEKSA
jgi:hypothetical protein